MEDNLVDRLLAGLGEALYTHAKEAAKADEAVEAVEYFETNIFATENK